MEFTDEYGTHIINGNIEIITNPSQKWIDEHISPEIKQEPIISTEDKIKMLEEAIVELTLKQLEGGTNGTI